MRRPYVKIQRLVQIETCLCSQSKALCKIARSYAASYMLLQIAKGLNKETKACTDQNNDLMQIIQSLCGIIQSYVKK